ncbi:hypothetical protein POVWA2_090270 [Plasmodium ovale wallikeri]|uniref:Uncharacterized protein n=1 Tax=Plasmodium ovale wallikeri TaxID=864142 RepID=A0A1A9ARZ7_PLAOA|nr:hypothetical protein POVWA1_033580 [Plasmodium ovale wallikeri]SBT58996.1 hypothetical protein POVWA2_090270 [Plasmodium ovale wallikeri]
MGSRSYRQRNTGRICTYRKGIRERKDVLGKSSRLRTGRKSESSKCGKSSSCTIANKEVEAAKRAKEPRIAEKAKEVADIVEDAVKEVKKKATEEATAKEKAIQASQRAIKKSGKSQNWDMSELIDVSPGESADITHKEEDGEYEGEEIENAKQKGDIWKGENKDEHKNEKKKCTAK